MGTNAQLKTRAADGWQIGAGEIFLAQVNKVTAQFKGELPMIINDQLAVIGGAERVSFANFSSHC